MKTDFINFDNFDLNAEPDSCHCPNCVRGFRERLRTKYSPAERMERFGFSSVDYVNPPQWNQQNPPARMEIIFDPAIQEWIDFRCQVMADALRELALFAKSLNPEVVIEVNPHGITGGNSAWEAGIDHARILKSTQVFWTEEPNMPGLLPDGRLISKIRSYKLARAYDNILFTYISARELHMAECLAFNQTIGFAGSDPLTPAMRKYIAFYRRHRDLFSRTRDAGGVALLRSYPSITYNHARCQLSAILAEQALVQARVPFQLVFDEHLADLAPYRVLILPDSECMSDGQIDAVKKFVAAGGGLVVIGRAGLYDHWRRLRVNPGLAGLVDSQPRARDYEEQVVRSEAAGAVSRKEIGGGRVVYLPALQFNGRLPELGNYFKIDSRFWKLPKNWRELVEGVAWASKDSLPIEVAGPEHLIANLVAQEDRRRTLLHLVNYKPESVVEKAEVTWRPPRGQAARQIDLYSPDTESSVRLEFRGAEWAARFTVPEVRTYAIVVMQ